MQLKAIFTTVIVIIFGFWGLVIKASELEIPFTFTDGEVTSASEMNANFEAIKAAVNDNNSRISATSGTDTSSIAFVGASTGKVDGSAGIFAMQQQCAAFSPGSRVCNISEIINAPHDQASVDSIAENSAAWVFLGNAIIYEDDTVIVPSVNRRLGHYMGTSCYGYSTRSDTFTWASNQYNGAPTVSRRGTIGKSRCSATLQVACCK